VADLLIFGPDGVIGNRLRYPRRMRAAQGARHGRRPLAPDQRPLRPRRRASLGHQLNAALVRKLLRAVERGRRVNTGEGDPPLEIASIMKILPHRYPFLLVDRVIELDPGRRIVALKNVTCNEPFFQGHWPGRPIMPGVLLIEALAQAAGVMFGDLVDSDEQVALMVSINDVKIRRPVVPGDQLLLEVTGVRVKSSTAHVKGVARVGAHVAAEAEIRFVMVEKDRAA
jgi:UDP-3-O-[3-hydroxymyristoyl] N-acetylglucosamine deacetylase/3-hydroxyacyl-[acyl-carrier-protein] dehydratase